MRDEVGSPRSIEIKKQMEEKERNLQIIESQIEKSNRNREKALKKFRKKYEQYNKFIDHMEPALQVYRCDNS